MLTKLSLQEQLQANDFLGEETTNGPDRGRGHAGTFAGRLTQYDKLDNAAEIGCLRVQKPKTTAQLLLDCPVEDAAPRKLLSRVREGSTAC